MNIENFYEHIETQNGCAKTYDSDYFLYLYDMPGGSKMNKLMIYSFQRGVIFSYIRYYSVHIAWIS